MENIMIKVVIDLSQIRNEIAILTNEIFKGIESDDNTRRQILSKAYEKLKTLRGRINVESGSVEIK
jgi:N-acetylglucosamine kinase-like BadF-type ATPase